MSLALTLAVAHAAVAQRVHGTVRDSLSGQPVAGAVVSALDAQGGPLARDLTNAVGAYSIMVPDSAATLRVVRLGYHPRSVSILPRGGGFPQVNVVLRPIVSLLEVVSIEEGAPCPQRADRQQALGLWEQARAGLLASVAARDARPGNMHSVVYQRLYAPGGEQLIHQQVRPVTARTSRPFVPSRPAADFAKNGYALSDGLGHAVVDAPDADILLDNSFAATHCFSIAAADTAHPGEVGLAFDPAQGREHLVDVAGVLWIDQPHPEIRSLEFKYTGLGKAVMRAGAGGKLSFRAMPNGVVFIDAWSIVTLGRAGSSWSSSFEKHVNGGAVLYARWDDGTHWEAPVAAVHGRVEGDSGVSSAGVRVWLVGTADTTVTDSSGAFGFQGVFPGPYALGAAGALLAPAGVSQASVADSVRVTSGGVAPAVVHLRAPASAVRSVCRVSNNDSIPGSMLVVRELDADGWIVWGDSVTVTWPEPSSHVLGIPIPHKGTLKGETNGNGRVAFCDVPRDELLNLVIGRVNPLQMESTFTLPGDHPIGVVTMQLPRPRVGG